MPPAPTSPPTPQCKAMLLCDTTIVESGTGKVSIVGTFESFHPQCRPIILKAFQVFLQVYGARGRYDVTVEIQELQNGDVLVTVSGLTIEIGDRLARSNIIIPIPSMQVSRSGEFDMVVRANGDEVARQQFSIYEVPDVDEP